MIRTIFSREFFDHVASFRFLAIFALALLLMTATVYVFSFDYEQTKKETPPWPGGFVDQQGSTSLGSVPCNSANLRRTPSPLAFCSGIGEQTLPNQAYTSLQALSGLSRTTQVGERYLGSRYLNWGFIVSVILSFAAGLFTYRSISGERSDGTLTLVLSNPLARGKVLLGKYLAALFLLTVTLFIAMILGLLTIQLTGVIQLSGDHLAKLVFFFVASIGYLSVFVLIGLFCSVVGRSPLLSAVIFLFSWAFVVFIIPATAGVLSGLISKAKTPLEIRTLADAINIQYKEGPGIDLQRTSELRTQEDIARERLLLQYLLSLIQQLEKGKNIARISPAATYSYAVEDISGGGTNRLMSFLNNVVRYRDNMRNAVIEADRDDPQSQHIYVPWNSGSGNFSQRSVDLGPVKEFRDPEPSSTDSLVAAIWDVALLAIFNLLLFSLTYVIFSRQAVTPTLGV